jgi:hypothetical protein
MREYQLEGLAWMVNKFDHGTNAILADEMVRRLGWACSCCCCCCAGLAGCCCSDSQPRAPVALGNRPTCADPPLSPPPAGPGQDAADDLVPGGAAVRARRDGPPPGGGAAVRHQLLAQRCAGLGPGPGPGLLAAALLLGCCAAAGACCSRGCPRPQHSLRRLTLHPSPPSTPCPHRAPAAEFKKWCPSLRVVRLHTSDPLEKARLRKEVLADPSQFDVAVTTYDMINSKVGPGGVGLGVGGWVGGWVWVWVWVGGWGWLWVAVGGCGWLGGCGWVGVGGCGCGWMWVGQSAAASGAGRGC